MDRRPGLVRLRRLACFAACLTAFAIGAQAPTAGTAPAPSAATSGVETRSAGSAVDAGTVVFFRGKEALGALVGYTIYDGTVEIGKLKYGTYFAVQLPAGSHQFTVNSWRRFPFPLDIEAGKTYYLLGGMTTEDIHPFLWVSTETAFQDMRGNLEDLSVNALAPPPPPRSQPTGAGATRCHVFGRLKVVGEDGRVYYPIVGASLPKDTTLVERFEPDLSLLRLDSFPRDDWTDLKFRRDGLVTGSVAPGDYVLASLSQKRAGRAKVEVVALLRVPDVATSVYVGDLTITIALRNSPGFLDPQPYEVTRADVKSDLGPAREAYESKSGPLVTPPAVSSWCLDTRAGEFLGYLNRSVAIATLSTGCQRPDVATGVGP